MVSKIQTGRKIRNQFQWILESSLRTSMIRKISAKIQESNTRWARDIFIYGGLAWSQYHSHPGRLGTTAKVTQSDLVINKKQHSCLTLACSDKK